MSSWPSTLPDPMSDGYSIAPIDQTLRTDMEMGAARARRITSARNDALNVVWKMTDAQLATFRTWFDSPTEAAGGSAWFTISLALGTGGLVSTTARFSGAPKIAHAGSLRWTVSAALEVR